MMFGRKRNHLALHRDHRRHGFRRQTFEPRTPRAGGKHERVRRMDGERAARANRSPVFGFDPHHRFVALQHTTRALKCSGERRPKNPVVHLRFLECEQRANRTLRQQRLERTCRVRRKIFEPHRFLRPRLQRHRFVARVRHKQTSVHAIAYVDAGGFLDL